MKELRLMIIDARQINVICSLQTYINERLSDLYADSRVSDIKLAHSSPDYFVFSYFINASEDGSSEEDYKPP